MQSLEMITSGRLFVGDREVGGQKVEDIKSKSKKL